GRSTTRLLRYALRSATKLKDEKPPFTGSANSISAAKRERVQSSVSKSVEVLNLSGKEKSSAKPPRRLSVPNKKPNATLTPKSISSITPISETRAKSAVSQGKSDTPRSDISNLSARKKFSTLSSPSYWLSQIKLSESASKHSISLGFFKLALEAGCEPIQRLSDELKSYVRRHDLSEHGEVLKLLLEGYKIPESFELSKQYSDDDVKSSSSSITYAEEKQKPADVIMNADTTQHVKKANKENSEKDGNVKATKRSVPNRAASSKPDLEVKGRGMQKKTEKLLKQESAQDKDKVKKQGKKSVQEEGD
ncbi:riboflavin kinase/FMN hydrolase, partial [Striga asiatica]